MSQADSAGVPWEGRSFESNPHAGDDGSADAALLAALALALAAFVTGEQLNNLLAHARQAREDRRDDARTVVVAVSGQVVDGDLGVGKGLGQIGVQGFGGHGHGKHSARSPPSMAAKA